MINNKHKDKLNKALASLQHKLPITGLGYKDFGYQTPIYTFEEYSKNKDPYNSECLVLPDGRIVPAEPSHQLVLSSLVDFIEQQETDYSMVWFYEELLLLTQSVVVYEEMQKSFFEPNQQQATTLKKMVDATYIKSNLETCHHPFMQERFKTESSIAKNTLESA